MRTVSNVAGRYCANHPGDPTPLRPARSSVANPGKEGKKPQQIPLWTAGSNFHLGVASTTSEGQKTSEYEKGTARAEETIKISYFRCLSTREFL